MKRVLKVSKKIIDSQRSMPFDVLGLCLEKGIKIKPLSLYLENGFKAEEFFTSIGNEDGAASRCGDDYYIFYNDFKPRHRVRFTLAEELMHILLGHVNDQRFALGRDYDQVLYQKYEQEAKLGAGLILLPPNVYYYNRILYRPSKIARMCDISTAAAYKTIPYYIEHEQELKDFFGSYCPRCIILPPDMSYRPISVLGEML